MPQDGFCILIETVCEGVVAAVYDEYSKPVIFASREEAQRELADTVMTKLQEFLNGERDFNDAMTLEEYVADAQIQTDGSIYSGEIKLYPE